MKGESSAAHLRPDSALRATSRSRRSAEREGGQGYGGQAASDRWERLAVLFEGALALPPAERDDYLRLNCSDPGIAAEIRTLLAAQISEAGPIERVMAALGSPGASPWRDAAPR